MLCPMTTPLQNWLIRVLSWIAVAAAGVGLFFHEYVARSIFGSAALSRRAIVVVVLGVVVGLALGFAKEAGKRLRAGAS